MNDKLYQNRYRVPSARRPGWDYGSNGAYFITICTRGRECFFGEIVNGEMVLNEMGKIVATEWLKTFEMRQDMNLQMGAYVVMPNHFHAIIVVGENKYNQNPDIIRRENPENAMRGENVENVVRGENAMRGERRDAMHRVSTGTTDGTIVNHINGVTGSTGNRFGTQSKNLASIIRGFKSAVTIQAREINPDFGWQPRFHDHIIRNGAAFQRITEYIINNPAKWKEDRFYK
ncbi:MAG: hypothetical protein M0P66_07730 [Salinivirgaceae bacterium]|nr:hypothetical protein [Salinivirgaceae bacterium]